MPTWKGSLWRDGDADEAWVGGDAGRLLRVGSGRAPADARPAVLLQGLTNYHTHVGDAILRGRDVPRSLAEAVQPPHGFKHRGLAAARAEDVRRAIQTQLRRYADHGAFQVVDFREQGVAGVALAREAAAGAGVQLHLLGRAARNPADPEELARVAHAADGIGLPSRADVGDAAALAAAEAARAAGKPFALHVSESEREDMESVLALGPDLVVHGCEATRADLRLLAESGTPLVACPGANAFFHLKPPPVGQLEEVGGSWFLGTDNAMLGLDDLVAEARRVHALFPEVPDASILRALTTRPQNVLNGLGRAPPSDRAPLLVLPCSSAGAVQWEAPPTLLRP